MATWDETLSVINCNDRICPMPGRWSELYELLLEKKNRVNSKELPLPLTLASWWYSAVFEKKARLVEQIQWAADHGCINELYGFLVNLREADWYHTGDQPFTE